MSGELTPAVLMAKAVRACASARVLLELDDVDGVCHRAYYAMFDAARAALPPCVRIVVASHKSRIV